MRAPTKSFRPLFAAIIFLLMATMATSALCDEDLILIDAPELGPGPGSYRITSEDGIVRFPFDLYGGDIRFEAEINGQAVHMLIDDGFMWDPLLFWGSDQVETFGFKYDGESTIDGGPTDDKRVSARTASGITVSFPGVEFAEQTAHVTAYTSGNASMWEGSVGQVSCTFLKHFVVDINFDEMMMTLIEPDKFEYQGKGVAIPWRPTTLGPWSIPVTLELADNRTVAVDVLMDLGYNDQLQINPTGPNKLIAPDRSVPISLGMNIQRVETLGRNGRVPTVTIGGYKVKNVIAGFMNEEHADQSFSEVMIGLGLLSRFNLVFDYTRQRLFVEPNTTFDDPYEHGMTGMALRRGRNMVLEVGRIAPDSPASEAELQVGDRITMVNGRPAADCRMSELEPLFMQVGETLTLMVTRGGTEREVKLTLRRLI